MAERRSGDLRSGGCGSVGDRPQLVETGHNWWRPATNWWRPATNWWRPATTGGGRPQLVEAGHNWWRPATAGGDRPQLEAGDNWRRPGTTCPDRPHLAEGGHGWCRSADTLPRVSEKAAYTSRWHPAAGAVRMRRMIESPPNATSSAARTAWLMVALLVPVALLNYLDRQMLAAMKSSMMGDVPDIATRANWGIALGAFKWVYAIMSPVGGYLADRHSRRHVIAASLFIWSAVTWATGHVTSFHELVAARALMGISEAFYIPAALALIADFHWGATRSRAVGLHQMGMYAGIVLGGFAGYIADDPRLGWRWAFSACGLAGVLYSVPLLALLRNPPREPGSGAQPSPVAAIGELFGNAGFVLLVMYFTLPALAGWVVKDWMPDILKEQFDLGQGQAG